MTGHCHDAQLKSRREEIVCLVDDDSAVLKSIGRLLASDGFTARAFDQPKGFLAHLHTNAVPLVVLDIWMGQMNGLGPPDRSARRRCR
jgi:FixJ family two-component response regulator